MSIERARALQQDTSDAERLLWWALRPMRTQGVHFRRQAPIGRYVADFACHRAKIVVELDGSQHGEEKNAQHDAERTAFLESRGYRVLRFWNSEVIANLADVADFIFAESRARLSPHPIRLRDRTADAVSIEREAKADRPPRVGGGER